jgi:hypothetical protein
MKLQGERAVPRDAQPGRHNRLEFDIDQHAALAASGSPDPLPDEVNLTSTDLPRLCRFGSERLYYSGHLNYHGESFDLPR